MTVLMMSFDADDAGPLAPGTLSRPSVSDDNPFIESLFRTLKYRPE
jgi:hypothetical protein